MDQTSSSAPVIQQWRLNSLYDFDYTKVLADHQPYFYDQLTAIYNKYKVYAVKLHIEFSSSKDAQIVFRSTVLGTAPSNMILEAERPGAVSYAYAAGGPPVVRTLKYKMANIFGVGKSDYRDGENYSGQTPTSNPTSIAYLNCMTNTPRDTTSQSTLKVVAQFYCKFYERVPVGQS